MAEQQRADQKKSLYIESIPPRIAFVDYDCRIDLREYLVCEEENPSLTYTLETLDGLPQGMAFDEKEGLLHSEEIAAADLNKVFVIFFKATDETTGHTVKSVFTLEVKQFPAPSRNAEENLWRQSELNRVRQFIQQLINDHFVCIAIYDANMTESELGNIQRVRQAKTGWTIRRYENVILAHPDEKTYALYGNRGRFLSTVYEMFSVDYNHKSWQNIGIDGTDLYNMGRAWIIGKQMQLPVSDEAPTEEAVFNYRYIQRLYERLHIKPSEFKLDYK
jgi:hypothetical protein